jgi:alpha-D-ribose 1-methylphosphonate 5-triphosphate synthase subunit PhnH
MPAHPMRAGFRNPVRESQAVFRRVMEAMASPGRIVEVPTTLAPHPPLAAPAASLLLTLCDFETPLWLDRCLAGNEAVAAYPRFHTGAKVVAEPGSASFAVIGDAMGMPALAEFAQGTAAYPERSSTLIVQVETLSSPGPFRLEGPGLKEAIALAATPLPTNFAAQLASNRAAFPCGVDVLLVTSDALAALPRSVRVTEKA